MKEAITKMFPQLGWGILIAVFVLVGGLMVGKASAEWENQKLQISIECMKAGGTVTSTDKGGMICTTKK